MAKGTADALVRAALEVVSDEGVRGATARTIAARADCNQALIFYHFGTLEELLVAALQQLSASRFERFAPLLSSDLAAADVPGALVELIDSDVGGGDLSALVALIELSRTMPLLRAELADQLGQWQHALAAAMEVFAAAHGLEGVVPQPEAAQSMMAWVVGLELLTVAIPGMGAQVVRMLGERLSAADDST